MDTANTNININENVVSHLWAKYAPYWPLYILLVGVLVGGAWLYLRYKLPVYESSATILIKDEKKGTEDSKMMEALNQLSTKKIIENEIEVIRSRALVSQVVRDLKLYAPVYQAGKWKDIPAYTASPVRVEVQQPDSLIEVKRVSFSYDKRQNSIVMNKRVYPLNSWINTRWATIKFTLNNGRYQDAGSLYFSLVDPRRVTLDLIKSLDVSPVNKLSSVLVLKIRDEVPARSENILNTLISAYNQAAIDDKNTLASNTLSFVDQRLLIVENDLKAIEQKLQQYRSLKGAIDISSQGKLFLENVSLNDQKLSEVNMKLAVLDQVEQYVFSKTDNSGLAPATLGVDDPVLTALLNKLSDAELQYEKLKRTTAENNPMLVSIADQIEKIKPGIVDNIRGQRQGLQATKANLYSTNNNYASVLQTLPQQEKELVQISREQNIKTAIYNFLLQKREETALSHSSTVADSGLIDKAESTLTPVGPSDKLIYLAAVLLAIGLGIMLVTVKEIFTPTILFRDDIERLTSFAVIGEISSDKSKSPLVISKGRSSLIAEEFRLLRTSLHYLGLGSGSKKILITSTISGEGKSFVAVNLATSLAMSGKKVVLVELDLTNPTLGKKLGITTGIGASEYLSGNADVHDILVNVENNDNLFVIPAGHLPEDPSELLLSQRTPQLLNYLEDNFDYVIIDSAPVGLLSDGYVLSRLCDATLFVVRHKHTPRKLLQRLEQNSRINHFENLAIVFNGVKTRGFGLHKYGYGFGYGNGYVYGGAKKRALGNSAKEKATY